MPIERKFTSPTGGNKCGAAQYLAELMISRKASKDKIHLPPKFWRQAEWKSAYLGQIYAANALLKLYDIEAILAALNHKDGSWQYSLRTKSLIPLIETEQRKIDNMIEQPLDIDGNVSFQKTKSFGKKSKRSKL